MITGWSVVFFSNHLRTACFAAIVLHLLLALCLPAMPEFVLPTNNRATTLNVFLKKDLEPEEFVQALDDVSPDLGLEPDLLEAALEAASRTPGDESIITEEALQTSTQHDDSVRDTSPEQRPLVTLPRLLLSHSFIRRFTNQEASHYAEQNPDDVERFRRTFNQYRSNQRRSRTSSYQNRFGDHYVRDHSSSGDICFVQRREKIPDELSSRTVYFFRCDSKPIELDLSTKKQG